MKKIFQLFVFIVVLSVVVFDVLYAREGVVRGSYVNLRAEKNFNSEIIGKKLRGQKYTVEFEDKGWLKVKFDDGAIGWIYETLTEKKLPPVLPSESKSIASAPILPKLPEVLSSVGKATGTVDVTASQTLPKIGTDTNVKISPDSPALEEKGVQTTKKETSKEKQTTPSKTGQKDEASKKTVETSKTSEVKEHKASETSKTDVKSLSKADKTKTESETTTQTEKKDRPELSKDLPDQQKDKTKKKVTATEKASKDLSDQVKAKDHKKSPEKPDEKMLSEKTAEKIDQSGEAGKTVVSFSKSPEEYYNLGIELYEKKRYSEALEANRAAFQQAPGNPEIINNMANCYFKLGKIEEALKYWKDGLALSPKSAKICNNIGIAYYQLDENDKAIEYYKKAILFEPDFPDPYYNLASVYGYKGNFKEALSYYRKYLTFSIDPTMKQMTEERIEYCQKQLESRKEKSKEKSN